MKSTSPNAACVSSVFGRARESAACIFPMFFLIFCSCQCPAAEPAADYVHSYRSIVFANGLTAILNPRQETRSVSIRVVVDVGQLDFDCENRELPHLAEHLMFSGTSTHTESELDDLIESLGGSWNAVTDPWNTTYELDIHHDYVYDGLAVLHEVFTDTQLTDETVQIAKDVIDLEAGGAPGAGAAVPLPKRHHARYCQPRVPRIPTAEPGILPFPELYGSSGSWGCRALSRRPLRPGQRHVDRRGRIRS